jgi:L,D-peptidoglycan transpeptidase YkuD (ErfK/YbiS/YcfS/YnhG family)
VTTAIPRKFWPAPLDPGTLAARLTSLPTETTQCLIVWTQGFDTSYATLGAYQKLRGVWIPAGFEMPARIGSLGLSDNHVEGVPTTPTGTYGFGATMYGIDANPGVKYPYHRLVSGDWWDENPNSPTYNQFVHQTQSPGGASEALWQIYPAYAHFAVITYNMPDAVPGKGSAIFLHQSTGGATAGCISLPHDQLVGILTWLDPAKAPRITMQPIDRLT